GIEMRQVDHDPQLLAGVDDGAPERRESLRRRPGRSDQAAVAREVPADVGEADAAHAQLVEGPEQVDVGAERLDALHRDDEPDASVGEDSVDLAAFAADREAGIVRDLLVEQRQLVDRDAERELGQVAVVEEDRSPDDPDSTVVELLPEVASED